MKSGEERLYTRHPDFDRRLFAEWLNRHSTYLMYAEHASKSFDKVWIKANLYAYEEAMVRLLWDGVEMSEEAIRTEIDRYVIFCARKYADASVKSLRLRKIKKIINGIQCPSIGELPDRPYEHVR